MSDNLKITDSILLSIKPMLNISETDSVFDEEVIAHINSALAVAHQLGIGSSYFSITGDSETWKDFINDEEYVFSSLKEYVYLKTKIVFDPPTSASLLGSMKNNINELEWRLNNKSSFQ